MIVQAKRNEFTVALPKKERLKSAFDEVLIHARLQYAKDADRLDRGMLAACDNGPGDAARDAACDAAKNAGRPAFRARRMGPTNALDLLKGGIVDLAVVGYDTLREFNAAAGATLPAFETDALENVAACSLWIATAESDPIHNWSDLEGRRIATKYAATLTVALAANGVKTATVVAMKDGGAEEAVDMGIADTVAEITQSGETLEANGLVPRLKLYDGCAMLVRRAGERPTPQMAALRERFIAGAQHVRPDEQSRAAFADRFSRKQAQPARNDLYSGASTPLAAAATMAALMANGG